MTRSPQINQVLEHARARAAGRTAPELKPALDQAAQMLVQMQKIFEAQIRFRERTEVVRTQQPRMQSAFARTLAAIEAIREERFAAGADELEQWFGTLMEASDALRAEEEAWPVYSRSPYMNILMRLAKGVAKGTIAPEALAQGLTELLANQRRVASKLDGAVRPGPEATRYMERRDEIGKHVQVIDATLVEAQTMLMAGRVTAIPQCIERACQAADALLSIQDDFQQAEEADRHRPCFRCGASNPRAGRHCVKCGAMMPPMPVNDHDVAAVDVTLEEGRAKPRGHVRTELTVKLEDAAYDARQGKIEPEAFSAVLDEAEARLVKARQAFSALQMPANLSAEEREAAIQAAEAMTNALGLFDEGLQRMRAYLLDGNTSTLDHGLETALSAGDTLAAFQEWAKQPT